MPPLPKRKLSARRQGNRRSHHRVDPPALTPCPHCHKPRRLYHVCRHCGYYGDRQVLEVEDTSPKG
ncbi:MAG: 50S ribosomal protein L32 [Chloroflexi bacterium]|nr:50S ribosomal protein L32 [Chloroflexota bacterium]MBI4506304.1 50S ribosomal protein L32 [Chloroflexota bacterium]